MDANGFLCEGGLLQWERLREAIGEIEASVQALLRQQGSEQRKVLIAQTGQARELALQPCTA